MAFVYLVSTLELYGINTMDYLKILFFALFIIAVVVGGPIATILALNVLFNLSIEVNTVTWLASFWLSSLVGNSFLRYKKD